MKFMKMKGLTKQRPTESTLWQLCSVVGIGQAHIEVLASLFW